MPSALPVKKRLRIEISDIVDRVGFAGHCSRTGFRVLLYHSITEKTVLDEWQENTTHKELFLRQMKCLRDENYNVISCAEAVNCLMGRAQMPERAVAVTLDDGYMDNCINALPILKEYNIPATIFLPADILRPDRNDHGHLNRECIRDMKQCGLIDFGCHGMSHKILSCADEGGLDREITLAKRELEYLTDGKIELFAYPFGHSGSYNTAVIEKIRSAGFLGAFTTIHGFNDIAQDRFLLRRNRISWLDELKEFKKHLRGSYDWCSLCECFRRKIGA